MAIRRICADDWQAFRDLRLTSLRTDPTAFGESFDAAHACTDAEWRERAARLATSNWVGVAAVVDDTWVGMMRGLIDDDVAWLLGAYVIADQRGTDTARLLLAEVVAWAAERVPTMVLECAEDNVRARTFYERNGFTATGRSRPHDVFPDVIEIEMTRSLG